MGIKEDLEEIKGLMQEREQVKEKKFKLPFGKKVSKSQRKKGWVTVIKINNNGALDIKKTQANQQTIMEDDVPRLATPDHILQWKGNPVIILPEWSVEPFSPVQHFKQSMENNSNSKGYKILLAKMLEVQSAGKKSMGGIIKWIIGLGLAGIIIYALLG